jgi:methylmalonyl-CoA mutase
VRSAFSPADAVAAALSGEELGTWVGIDALGSRWVDPLTASTLAAPFEALRDQALAASERLGRPLAVYLACVGKHTSFAPRAQFARQLFAAGGFLVHESGPELELSSHAARFAESRAQVAAICGADADYAVAVLPLASALVTAGALEVYVAGKPSAAEAEQREAGVTGYFFLGQDAVSFLDKALSRAGGGA